MTDLELVKRTNSEPAGAGFESLPKRKFSDLPIFPFPDRHGFKRLCLNLTPRVSIAV
jgi:hypothetical protein